MGAPIQVQGAATQPLPAMRETARLYAAVWSLPHLFPGTLPVGKDPRRKEVELVKHTMVKGG